MTNDIYERLANYLDKLPGGFPHTESQVEIRILHQLFTPHEAELAIHLKLFPEKPQVIAQRAGIPVDEALRRLKEMEAKGLIMSFSPDNKVFLYMALQYIVGIWEAQLNKLNAKLIQDHEEYLETVMKQSFWHGTPQMRTIPINRSINIQNAVMTYENAEDLVNSQKSFAVSHCICRKSMRIIGKGCNKPEESCLTFGHVADSSVNDGRARAINKEEALSILQIADEAGFVLQPNNAKDPLFICTCCGCCCGVLKTLKHYPEPASMVVSAFAATMRSDTCKGCGLCVKRCQMEAIRINNKKAVLDVKRCIGCGLCVSTCPTNSVSLVRKPDTEQPYVPKDFIETNMILAKNRGKHNLNR